MAGRDSHLVCIELYRSVIAEMVREQCPELVEQLILAAAYRLLCQVLVCFADVLDVEEQRVYRECYILLAILNLVLIAACLNIQNIYSIIISALRTLEYAD